jgi:HAMP domain-containing protein
VSASEKYVAAAYLVVFVAVLVWVAIIAAKLARLERDAGELTELARRRSEREPEHDPAAERDEVGV